MAVICIYRIVEYLARGVDVGGKILIAADKMFQHFGVQHVVTLRNSYGCAPVIICIGEPS
jgi:hypothetical protein